MSTSAPLRELIVRLWGEPGPDAPVLATLDALPGGYRPVETYAVVPSPANARFLVPIAGRAAAAATLTCYNRLRSGQVRATRRALGAGFRTGLAQRLLKHRLTVGVRSDIPAEQAADHLLGEHLRRVLDVPEIVFGLGVRPIDPNGKPTLQVFSGDGAPLGYAKIGWSPATKEMAATEASAVEAVATALAAADGPSPRVPALLHHGPWRDLLITVTAPLPARVTGHGEPDSPPEPGYALAVADTVSAGWERLTDMAFWRRMRDEVAAMGEEPDLADAMTAAMDGLEERHAELKLRIGRWHGDWVPWNVGHHGGELHVFDWEHSAPDAPVGLDLLHWRFQVALVLRGASLGTAVEAVESAAQTELDAYGVAAEARELLARLYLLEMFTRTHRLKRGGGGWNPALFPAMLDVLARWRP
ncbi:hypothetical protein E1293_03900 [Actinomadura darangshiensis]|uniref:Aminoglycoside phosphotransferase domain-containing protein n=1 Tax=Actinomadura darangshiensis TaxID=705336 RepID=A0A4R5BWY3_9ACTN|nr:hypothetical protein [Actinomadura darangshiensis]TDD90183.1 hypothetical protein E1293_03900 [Actinomadura darangshiensis]